MTTTITTPINVAMTQLLHELAEEVPGALTAEFSLACLWADLCRIAAEPVPADVAAGLDAPLDLAPLPVPLSTLVEHAPVYAD